MKWNIFKRKSRIGLLMVTTITVVLSVGLVAFDASQDFKYSKSLDIFFSLFRELNMYYVDQTDPEKLVKTGIDEMLKSLDPYTTFIPESELDELAFMTTGQYGGIGSLVRKSGDYAVISELYKDFPADKAGLKPGDVIKEVNGKSTKGLPLTSVSDMLKGQPNTELEIVVERYGTDKPIRKTLTREKIQISSVPYYGMLDQETGYIRMSSFTQNSAREVRDAYRNLMDKFHPLSLILDLRSNPGGLLIEAVDLSNIFVDKNQEIVSTKGKIEQWNSSYRARFEPVDTSIPIAVLVNHGTASAAEIVAGALQDLDRAVVVGQRTFGKGLVQTTRQLSYNTKLKVTTAKYYIPSGRCIQALDYSHRNPDGSVGYVPDSLITAFKTRNGRTVYDGGGIRPDVEVPLDSAAEITSQLYTTFQIFDFATRFSITHPLIDAPSSFTLADDQYQDFIRFLKERKFQYHTGTEEAYNDLVKSAEAEKYYELSKDEFEGLRKKIIPDIDKDLMAFKEEIIELLNQEIVSRYYYEAGSIETSLRYDKQLKEAIRVLKNKQQYASILHLPGTPDQLGLKN
jgi:carboxyl-terminal processing protease